MAYTADLPCLGFGRGCQEQTVQERGLGTRLGPSSALRSLSVGTDACVNPPEARQPVAGADRHFLLPFGGRSLHDGT